MLNADQLDDAARRWRLEYNYGEDDGRGHLSCGGPYRVLVAEPATACSPKALRSAHNCFTGVDIAYLSLTSGGVVTGQLSLYVVGEPVYVVLGWQAHGKAYGQSRANLEPAPFAAPPTEADLADVFVRAMSGFDGRATGYALASSARVRSLRQVCERLGWRRVAAMVNVMDEPTRASITNVLAVLAALSTQPAATS